MASWKISPLRVVKRSKGRTGSSKKLLRYRTLIQVLVLNGSTGLMESHAGVATAVMRP